MGTPWVRDLRLSGFANWTKVLQPSTTRFTFSLLNNLGFRSLSSRARLFGYPKLTFPRRSTLPSSDAFSAPLAVLWRLLLSLDDRSRVRFALFLARHPY